jgi:hypothetical protein
MLRVAEKPFIRVGWVIAYVLGSGMSIPIAIMVIITAVKIDSEEIIPRYETSSRRLERVRMKQRMVPTTQKTIVHVPWLVRVFIMIENVKT